MGAATALSLAERGARVSLVDQFSPPHAQGSSHGETRAIRMAYFEHPDYVPLLRVAYARWDELAARSGERLFERCGTVVAGAPDSAVVEGVFRAARQHDLVVDDLSASQAARRWPGLVLPADYRVSFEADAGLLYAERCVDVLRRCARDSGAKLIDNVAVAGWVVSEAGVRVAFENRPAVTVDRLVITAGSWTNAALSGAGSAPRLPLRLLRRVMVWLRTGGKHHLSDGFPVFAVHGAEDAFSYGFPGLEPGVMKLARHDGGDEFSTPETRDDAIALGDVERVLAVACPILPGLTRDVVRHEACTYTSTPDGHFVVGRHADSERVVIGAGFSGHGFKLAPAIGQALADLAVDGGTELPIEFLSPARFDGSGP